ncbi:transcription elongation factor 1 [Histomonas meleagridis]|uniref:transcription elongation factor 1 n=1 Tax=Histomonas meleagridis TaxID=135588 RepID=UPI00355AB8FA|nr:transcription elongation factor 1 [Histomonas meleagridis]KAH0799651.1 transcription elongation factor 1 [Histomonas meleagridis]
MGKKKKGKKVTVQKRVYKIPKFFWCPFCEAKDAVKITVKKKLGTASLICQKCGKGEQDIKIGPLDEPIDIYDQYIDSAREVNQQYNPIIIKPMDSRIIDESDDDIINDDTVLSRKKDFHDSDSDDSAYSDLESESD